MTVAEFIEYLKTQPQEIQVAYCLYSEHCLLDANDISVKELCERRNDGWLQNKRPDKPFIKYLVLPGN